MRPLVQLNRYGEELGGLQAFQQMTAAATDQDVRQKMLRLLTRVVARELTPRQRQMVERYYFDGRTILSIANELGVNKSTVSRGLKAARNRMEQCLKYLF